MQPMPTTTDAMNTTSEPLQERSTTFRTADGRLLSGTTFVPAEVRAALVVNGGTGIPQGFYARFARHAAARGFATLTYDYRGMGRSRVGLLREESARMSDWGRFDMAAAVEHQAASFPGVPAYVLGHSVGGQLVGLMPNHATPVKYAFVTVSTGTWWNMPRAYGLFTAALWYAVFPGTSALWGYVPGKRLGLGEDLPRGVAAEWGRWCTSRDYFVSALAADGVPSFHAEVDRPIWSLSFTDDPIANHRNATEVLRFYKAAKVQHVHANPSEFGRKSIGHLGFFRPANAALWDRPLDFFDAPAPS